jgi:hypothetical protein
MSMDNRPTVRAGSIIKVSLGGTNYRIALSLVVVLAALFLGIPWLTAEATVHGLVAHVRSHRFAFHDAVEPLRRLLSFCLMTK